MCERYVPTSPNEDMLESDLAYGLRWKKSNFDVLEDHLNAEGLTLEVTAMKQRLICCYFLAALRGTCMSVYTNIYSVMAF